MNARNGKLGSFVMTLLLLGMGVGLIYGNQVNTEVGDQIIAALQRPWIATLIGAVLILAVVLRWVGGFRKPKDSFIDFESEDGNVGISTKAICDFIERIGKEFAAVKSIDSRLAKAKDGINISLNVKVLSGNKIPELSQVLQQRVRQSVRESLGLETIGNISIKVQEIIGDPAKQPPEDPEHEA